MLRSKRCRTRLFARSHGLNPAHTASSDPSLPRKGKYYHQYKKNLKIKDALFHRVTSFPTFRRKKKKPKTTKHNKNSESNTIKKQMGKTLQVLFICLQQADMQINCLNSCVPTKEEEEMCCWQLAELNIPHPSPFLRAPRYSQQCQEKGCDQRNKGQEIKISPGICAAAGLLLLISPRLLQQSQAGNKTPINLPTPPFAGRSGMRSWRSVTRNSPP